MIFPSVSWLKCFMLVCWLLSPDVHALERISLSIEQTKGADWQLQKLRIVLENLQGAESNLVLHADQLILPPPLNKLAFFKLRCTGFSIQTKQVQCHEGRVDLTLGGMPVKATAFNFLVGAGQSYFHLPDLSFVKGRVSVDGLDHGGKWQLKITARELSLTELQRLFKTTILNFKKGHVDLSLTLDGNALELGNADLTAKIRDVTVQTTDGHYATENALLDSHIKVQHQKTVWNWQSHTALKKGALYIDPIYLETPVKKAVELDSVGHWQENSTQWNFDHLQLVHPGAATFTAHGSLIPSNAKWLKSAEITLDASKLQAFSSTYVAPFLLGSVLEGVMFSGASHAKFSFDNQAITALHIEFEHLDLKDPKQRLGLQQADAWFDWKKQANFKQAGYLKWQQLEFYALPLAAAQLNFGVTSDSLKLTKPVEIDFLKGNFAIQDFEWHSRSGQAAEIHFSGALEKISLEQLSKALDWTPLTGNISGNIPGIRYKNNRLDLDGTLNIQVFDGEINIKQLAVANMLSDVPKFYSDIQIERLNLKQLTEKFKFGSIEGLLSGFVNNLYLENWQPISFYAWLGTPDNDSTAHKISQKAVDNIAKIGGGGATDLISRSILGMFDSFGYSRLGLGCYLHSGVCQLMGLEVAKNGYYMVKGGGLPKIDVIGYNPRVDWKVLVERLGRVSNPDNMVVE